MTPERERMLLQAAVALVCIVPFGASLTGIALGAAWLQPLPATDLDSHFRYLSGLFLGMGIGFASCVPGIERKTGRFRLLGMMVVLGGLARLLSLVATAAPSIGHQVGLGIELGVVPLLLLWQGRVARLMAQRATGSSAAAGTQPSDRTLRSGSNVRVIYPSDRAAMPTTSPRTT